MNDDDPDTEYPDVRERLASEPTPRMPADVAAMLRATLERESEARTTDLAEAAAEPAGAASVRRRIRWRGPLLAAAGVVAVVAIGVPVISELDTGGSEDAATSQSDSSDSGSLEPNAAPDATSDSDGAQAPEDNGAGTVALTRDNFAAEVRAFDSTAAIERSTPSIRIGSAVSCTDGEPVSSVGRDASLDGDPAVLIATPTKSDRLSVRAVTCGPSGPHVTASAVVRPN